MFFFDEAHLLFNDAPKALLDDVEQVVRLIRSKGVGVYFVTQNPLDVPDTVLAQLGNRVQHALRAFTPRDQKAVKAAATTFRQNPKLKTEKAITELGMGEALVSMLEGKGTPSMVERTHDPPALRPRRRRSRRTSAAAITMSSPVRGRYDTAVDTQVRLRNAVGSAASCATPPAAPARRQFAAGSRTGSRHRQDGGMFGSILGSILGTGSNGGSRPRGRMTVTEKVISNAASSAARTVGRRSARPSCAVCWGA